ncbi:baseplate J/gp47 family protein [Paenibacillus sp. LX16]|uniref:baseplate J/gp47 family protein n=1 Tax=Paenibacillus sp. LX16 TaxID=1740264 RepID=UPI002E2AA0B7|nr:baseplate J/gp47 family protein [Paenibacillus sp. LX16]
MYDDRTFDNIMAEMLATVDDRYDKREGSIIYNALAPVAKKLAEVFYEFSIDVNLFFADTSTGGYLSRRTAEYGVNRQQATKAIRMGTFYGSGDVLVDIPLQTRYALSNSSNEATYVAVQKISTGVYRLECETPGVIGNQEFGQLIPVTYVSGLVRAELSDVLVPGEEAEVDEVLRNRYYDAMNEPAFGGNVADYKQRVNALPGVGATKVYPVWQGGGTVKCTIIASDYNAPSAALVDDVQTIIDPIVNSGQGMGLAPIDHKVTIAGVSEVTINVSSIITLEAGSTIGSVQPDVEATIADYLLALRKTWADLAPIIVRTAQIDARMLDVKGIIDVTDTRINGSTDNLTLMSDQIPVMGAVTLSE